MTYISGMSQPHRRIESDRENLLREATALVERAELNVPGFDEPIVVGFRQGGQASVFFGSQIVYQLNAANELRRAFRDGLLYKAESGRLIALRRERTAAEMALIRTELSADQLTEFLAQMDTNLGCLRVALDRKDYELSAQVPADCDVVSRIRNWLHALPDSIMIAASARL